MKSRIRTLIVDDEPLARERLRKLLEKEADFEVAGECGDGREALAAVEAGRPDLIFLDVQMPELDGFGFLSQLPAQNRPVVIFVTAYDKFALKAFDVHALDYLVKPFDAERFQRALRRARDLIQNREHGDLNRRVSELLADIQAGAKAQGRLAVKSGGRVLLLKTEDIDWIEAADNYVNLHVGNESHLHRETMSAIETKLPPSKFLRVSRSAIVNIDRIKELQPLFHGDYTIILRNGARLTLSRSHRRKLDRLLGRES